MTVGLPPAQRVPDRVDALLGREVVRDDRVALDTRGGEQDRDSDAGAVFACRAVQQRRGVLARHEEGQNADQPRAGCLQHERIQLDVVVADLLPQSRRVGEAGEVHQRLVQVGDVQRWEPLGGLRVFEGCAKVHDAAQPDVVMQQRDVVGGEIVEVVAP